MNIFTRTIKKLSSRWEETRILLEYINSGRDDINRQFDRIEKRLKKLERGGE